MRQKHHKKKKMIMFCNSWLFLRLFAGGLKVSFLLDKAPKSLGNFFFLRKSFKRVITETSLFYRVIKEVLRIRIIALSLSEMVIEPPFCNLNLGFTFLCFKDLSASFLKRVIEN